MKRFLIKLFGLSGSARSAARKCSPRARLCMEALEDRSLPSTTTTGHVFVVNTVDDPAKASQGVLSLREAIQKVNADKSDTAASPDTIDFAVSGDGVQVIQLNKVLPAISRPVVIDGLSQGAQGGGSYSGPPLVALTRGKNFQGDGVNIKKGNTTIEGLAIYGFKNYGLNIFGAHNTITADYIGVQADGKTPAPNSGNGIYLGVADHTTITGCTIENNGRAGILVHKSAYVTIGGPNQGDGNTISANGTGTQKYSGVYVDGNSAGVLIQDNTVQGNGFGLWVTNSGNHVPSGFHQGPYSIVLDGNTVDGSLATGITIDDYGGFGAKNVKVSNNDVENSASDGVFVKNSSNIDFDHNVKIAGNGVDGIFVGKGATKVTFTSNDIENNTGYGVHIKPKGIKKPDTNSNDTGFNTIQGNTAGDIRAGS
jgi:parallel beta-helix repeat protein